MAAVIYNSDLLNAISDVKRGSHRSLEIEVVGANANNKREIERAFDQVSGFFNAIYSSRYKCKGTLELKFKKVKRSSSSNSISIKGFKKSAKLSEVIYKILEELGVKLPNTFKNQNYIIYIDFKKSYK